MKALVFEKGEKYYTFMRSLFQSMNNVQKDYNWLITAFECYPQNKEYAEKLSGAYGWLTGDKLTDMIEHEDFQWVWGVLSAFPKSVPKNDILKYKFPYADGNSEIWQRPLSIQHPLAEIEIIAWDSSMTVIISKNDAIIDHVKHTDPLAQEFEKYCEWET